MFKKTILLSAVVALFSVSAVAKGHQGGKYGSFESEDRGFSSNRATQMDSSSITDITDEQKKELLYMVEEEKLARDVYAYLYEMWGSSVFEKIVKSEQRHMDSMKSLADKYELETPSTLDVRGEFENEELQAQYNTLIEKGKQSLVDALEVGVTIEETDIADLERILEEDTPKDFAKKYQNLLKGSFNHLKAFNSQLGR